MLERIHPRTIMYSLEDNLKNKAIDPPTKTNASTTQNILQINLITRSFKKLDKIHD